MGMAPEGDSWSGAPGDLVFEVRVVSPGVLIAWDPQGFQQIAVAMIEESSNYEIALRAAIRSLANKVAENRVWIEGGE